MNVPGPPEGLWTLTLLLWALQAVVLGEAVRGSLARWVGPWRAVEPIERALLDLYLGGAAMYLLAALEIGAFVRPAVFAIPAVAAVVVFVRVARRRRRGVAGAASAPLCDRIVDRWTALALASALGLFLVELVAAFPIGTGNTYDASLLTTYVALLTQHGSLPLSFQPYGAPAILYPQGTTVWFAWAQLDFALPAARTSLLVTPLFVALAPLGGYVLGHRWSGSRAVGAAFAVSLAWLGPATRALVGGSNDFVVALPLVLLVAAQANVWVGRRLPSVAEGLAFGLLLGYSAAINVIGAEWLLPALLLLGVAGSPAFGGRLLAWLGRWSIAFAGALVPGVPSLYVLARARAIPATLAGELTVGPGSRAGLSFAQGVGGVDPFLFGPHDVELSPIPIVRVELAALLVLGVAALLWIRSERPEDRRWRGPSGILGAAMVTLIGWMGLLVVAGVPGSWLEDLAFISSGAELSVALFTIYGLLAAVPLGLAFARLERPPELGRRPSGPDPRTPAIRSAGAYGPIVLAIVLVVPAAVLTPASLTPVLTSTYDDFGNVSSGDFALLAYAATHFAAGERVLVAPGSAGEFLPGYAPGIVLVYPMFPGFQRANASYATVVRELSNGTLDASGREALGALELAYVVVTGNNSRLWPAFWAAPLVAAEVGSTRTFPTVFHEGDAWIFNASACRPASPGCG